MTRIIDPETMYVNDLPGIWSPVQWDLTDEERIQELHEQAAASLLWAIDTPEAILRMLLSETGIDRAFAPPPGYDSEEQGEWSDELVTFQFKRPFQLVKEERSRDRLYVEYKVEELGYWGMEIESEKVTIQRL